VDQREKRNDGSGCNVSMVVIRSFVFVAVVILHRAYYFCLYHGAMIQ